MSTRKIIIEHRLWTLDRTDYRFLTVIGACLLLAGVLLYMSFRETGGANENQRIGLLIIKKNLAQRKGDGNLIWEKVSIQKPVYGKDTLRTGELSSALVRLDNEVEIELGENTLLILDFEKVDKANRVKFIQGSVRLKQMLNAKDGSKAPKLEILTGVQKIMLDQSNVSLSKVDAKAITKIAVLGGEAKIIAANGIEQLISRNEQAILSKGEWSKQKQSLNLSPQKPADGAYFFWDKAVKALNFSWKAVPIAKNVQIEVSRNDRFTERVQRFYPKGSSYTTNLVSGQYYWRISAETGDGTKEYSVAYKFTLESHERLKLYRPAPQEVFQQSQQGVTAVHFAWKKNQYASDYIVEVATDPKFGNLVMKHTTGTTNYLQQMPPGNYYWRMKTRSKLPGAGQQSSTWNFKISKGEEKLGKIFLLRPSSGISLKPDKLQEFGYTLTWISSQKKGTTHLSIARDKGFKQILLSQSYASASQNLHLLKGSYAQGPYYWKIEIKDAQGKLIAKSETRSFKIEQAKSEIAKIKPPKIKESAIKALKIQEPDIEAPRLRQPKIKIADIEVETPQSISSLTREEIPESGLSFSWKIPKIYTGDDIVYKFQLSRRKDFRQVLSRKNLTSNSYKIKKSAFQKDGSYHWRVYVRAKGIYDQPATLADTGIITFNVVKKSLSLKEIPKQKLLQLKSQDRLIKQTDIEKINEIARYAQKQEAANKKRLEAERKRKLESANKKRLEAERKRKLGAANKKRREAERKRKLESANKKRLEAERKRKLESANKKRLEAERKRKLGAANKKRREAERKRKLEAANKKRLEAERKRKLGAANKKRREAERKRKLEAANKKRLEAERKRKLGAANKKRREAERKRKLEAANKKRLEAERKRKLEAANKKRLEAERKRKLGAANKKRREAERKRKLEAANKKRLEAERKRKLGAANKKRREAERKRKLEAANKKRREAERKRKLESANKKRLEAERKRKLESANKKRREAERKRKLEAANKKRLEAERKRKLEAANKKRREAERKRKLAAANKRRGLITLFIKPYIHTFVGGGIEYFNYDSVFQDTNYNATKYIIQTGFSVGKHYYQHLGFEYTYAPEDLFAIMIKTEYHYPAIFFGWDYYYKISSFDLFLSLSMRFALPGVYNTTVSRTLIPIEPSDTLRDEGKTQGTLPGFGLKTGFEWYIEQRWALGLSISYTLDPSLRISAFGTDAKYVNHSISFLLSLRFDFGGFSLTF